MLVDARPFQLVRFSAPPQGASFYVTLGVRAVGVSDSSVRLEVDPSFGLPRGTSVGVWDVQQTFSGGDDEPRQAPGELSGIDPQHPDCEIWSWSKEVAASQDMLLVVGPGDLDPASLSAFDLTFDHRLSPDIDLDHVASLTDLGPTEDCPGAAGGTIPLQVIVDQITRTVLHIEPEGLLAAGHRFQLSLDPSAIVVAPNPPSSPDQPAGQPLPYFATAPRTFLFSTRPVPGEPIASGSAPDVTDLLQLGNLMLGAGFDGTLYALDASQVAVQSGLGTVTPFAASTGAASQLRSLASDGHGRVFTAALLGSTWVVKAFRVEDILAAHQGGGTFAAVQGGVKVAYSLGTNSDLTPSEYLALGGLRPGTPMDLEVVVQDDSDEALEPAELCERYGCTMEGPDSQGNLTLHGLVVPGTAPDHPRASACDGECPYDRFQRVSIDDLTSGATWSGEVESPGYDTCSFEHGSAIFDITARSGDRLRVRRNRLALGYLALLGSGITVVDLNRGYGLPSPQTPGGDQCGRRLGSFEGEQIQFPACAGGGQRDGIAMTPSVAPLVPTDCTGGSCTHGPGSIYTFSPLIHVGPIEAQAPVAEPGTLVLAGDTICTREVKTRRLAGTNQWELTPVTLRDVTIAHDATWADHGITGTLDGLFSKTREPEAETRTGDLLLLSLGEPGIFVFDVSDRYLGQQTLIGHLHAPGHSAYRLQVDSARGLLLAGGFAADGAPILDVWDIAEVNGGPAIPCDHDADACPEGSPSVPRPLLTLDGVAWVTNHLGVDTSGTGLVTTWGGGSATVRPFAGPLLQVEGLFRPGGGEAKDAVTPELREVSSLVPLGIPMELTPSEEDAKQAENEQQRTAAFRVRVALPGSLGETVLARVQSMRLKMQEFALGRRDLGPVVAPPGGPGWPEPEVTITLRRQGDSTTDPTGRLSEPFSHYESDEVVLLLSDPRAAADYARQTLPDSSLADEKSQCRRCQRPSYLPLDTATPVKELLASGPYVRVLLDLDPDTSPEVAAFFAAQGDNYPAPGRQVEVEAWADEVPSPVQAALAEPVLNAAIWSPEEAGVSVSLVSGEALLGATDYSTPGKGLAMTLDRTYRSGTLGFGPLGAAGWHSSLFAHLRYLPETKEVEYFDGSGNVYRFVPSGGEADGERFFPIPGLRVRLGVRPDGSGWRMVDEHHMAMLFDRAGRLTEISDNLRRTADAGKQGSTITLRYDAFGQLNRVIDDQGREYSFTFDGQVPSGPGSWSSSSYGLLGTMTDFANRTVTYGFDDQRRLTTVGLPEVTTQPDDLYGAPGFPFQGQGRPTLRYHYFEPGAQGGVSPGAQGLPLHGALAGDRLEGFEQPRFGPNDAGVLRARLFYDPHSGRVTHVGFPNPDDRNDATASVHWDLGYGDLTGSAAPATESAIELSTPWQETRDYQLLSGRVLSVSSDGQTALGALEPTPPVGQPLPQVRLERRMTYTDDGRLETVTRADGSRVVMTYDDGRGDRLAQSRPTSVDVQRAAASPGFATFSTSATTFGYTPLEYDEQDQEQPLQEDLNAVSDNFPSTIRDPEQRRIVLAQPYQSSSGSTPTQIPSGYPDDVGSPDDPTQVLGLNDFDPFGRVEKTVTKGSPGEPAIIVQSTYAAQQRPGTTLLHKVEAGGDVLTFGYDEFDNVNRRTSTVGVDTFLNDEWNRPVQEVHGAEGSALAAVNAKLERAFDRTGHVVKERRWQTGVGAEAAGWVETTYTYNAREQLVRVTQDGLAGASPGDATRQATASYDYDSSGRLRGEHSFGGVLTTYRYQPGSDRLAGITEGDSGEPDHPAERQLGFDELGRLVYQKTDGVEGVWRGRYDAWGNLYQEDLASGASIRRGFDRAGALVQEEVFGDVAHTQPLGRVQQTVTSFGSPASVKRQVGVSQDGQPRYLTTEFSYYPSGRLRRVRSSEAGGPFHVEKWYCYQEGTGRIEHVEDRVGNKVYPLYTAGQALATGTRVEEEGGVVVTTSLTHDALGRVIEETTDGTTLSHTFDEAGNLLSWSSGGIGESATYDSRGLPLGVSRLGLGLLAEMGYDLDGHLVAKRVHGEGGRTDDTSWVYDGSGRLRSRALPGSATEELAYNPDNTIHTWRTRLLSHPADGPGEPLTIGYEYASGQRLRARKLENREAFDQGLPKGLAPLDFGDELELDPLGRPTTLAHKAAAGDWGTGRDPGSLVQVTLDSYRGLPTQERVGWWPGGALLDRGFDVRGNLTSALMPQPFAAPQAAGFGFQPDDLDRRAGSFAVDAGLAQVLQEEFAATITWHGVERLSGEQIAGPSQLARHLGWSGPAGRLGSLGVDGASGQLGSLSYAWDVGTGFKTWRLTSTNAGSQTLLSRQGWEWTPQGGGKLSGARSDAGGAWSHDYGTADELRALLEAGEGVSTFVPGVDGRTRSRTWPDGTVEDVGFDAEGRRIEDGRFRYTWDWRGRLVQVDVTDPASPEQVKRVSYGYDALGRMTTRTHCVPAAGTAGCTATGTTIIDKQAFLWDGDTLLAEVGLSNGEPIWRRQYLPGPAGLDDQEQVRVEPDLKGNPLETKVYTYVRDELGSVMALVEERAVEPGEPPPLVARYFYTPYGEAHLERGPELLSVRLDPAVTTAGGQDQAAPVPNESYPGAVVVETTIPLDPESLAAGVQLECRPEGQSQWVDCAAGTFTLAEDETDPTMLLVMPLAGWQEGAHYQITLLPELQDAFGREIQLPEHESGGVLIAPDPATADSPPSLNPNPRTFRLVYDSAVASADSLGGPTHAFRGGQNFLFQGLWTDPVTGLAYARNRWYDARTASWLTEDPAGPVDSPNLYAGFGLVPHMASDPMGLESGSTFSGMWQAETLNGRTVAEAIGPPATRAEAAFRGFVGGGLLLLGGFAAVGGLSAVLPSVAIETLGWGTVAAGATDAYGRACERYYDQYSAGKDPSLLVSGGLGLADTLGVSHAYEGVTGRDLGTGRLLSEQEAIARLQGGVANATVVFGGLGILGAARYGSAELFPSSVPGRGLASARISETGRGVYGNEVVDRIAAEAQGAYQPSEQDARSWESEHPMG